MAYIPIKYYVIATRQQNFNIDPSQLLALLSLLNFSHPLAYEFRAENVSNFGFYDDRYWHICVLDLSSFIHPRFLKLGMVSVRGTHEAMFPFRPPRSCWDGTRKDRFAGYYRLYHGPGLQPRRKGNYCKRERDLDICSVNHGSIMQKSTVSTSFHFSLNFLFYSSGERAGV